MSALMGTWEPNPTLTVSKLNRQCVQQRKNECGMQQATTWYQPTSQFPWRTFFQKYQWPLVCHRARVSTETTSLEQHLCVGRPKQNSSREFHATQRKKLNSSQTAPSPTLSQDHADGHSLTKSTRSQNIEPSVGATSPATKLNRPAGAGVGWTRQIDFQWALQLHCAVPISSCE